MASIMIVDHHPLMSLGLGSLLESSGFEVIAYEKNGDKAIKSALKLQPDLIIMDLYLPDYHGFEVLKVLKDMGVESKIIIFAAHKDLNYYLKCKEIGVEGYMLKHEMAGSLISIVNDVLANKIHFPDIAEFQHVNNFGNHGVFLTRKESIVFKHLTTGMKNRDIATKLAISEKTVSTHKHRIMKKFGVKNFVSLLLNTQVQVKSNPVSGRPNKIIDDLIF